MRQMMPALATVLIVAGCSQLPGDSSVALDAEAVKDIADGQLELRAVGLPAPNREHYAKLLKERLQVDLVAVAGCVVTEELLREVNSYNTVIEAEIKRRFGETILDDLQAESLQMHYEEMYGDVGNWPSQALANTGRPTISEVLSAYSNYRQMTPQPVAVNLSFSQRCIAPSQKQIDAEKRKYGPHAMTWILVYMNERAAAAFESGEVPYPMGSVIVKQKTLGDVGGMIKRAEGYDLLNGDWEYFYAREGQTLESGRLISCISCHRGAKATGFVYGDWHEIEEHHEQPTTLEDKRFP